MRQIEKTGSGLRTAYLSRFVARRWLLLFLILYGIFNLLPFLAPVFMHVGWETGGKAVYTAYSPLCHQMAQRSFFLFGPKVMRNVNELPVKLTGNAGADTLLLRRFRGDSSTGWKVAWSDRMVYMYGGLWLAAAAYGLLARSRPRNPIPLWLLLLLLMPMVIDGATHAISDWKGLTGGFRYHNEWLAGLTGNALPERFYSGDALGSFNSTMRLFSGLLFGIACVGFAFPHFDRLARYTATSLSARLDQWTETQRRLATELDRLLTRQ